MNIEAKEDPTAEFVGGPLCGDRVRSEPELQRIQVPIYPHHVYVYVREGATVFLYKGVEPLGVGSF